MLCPDRTENISLMYDGGLPPPIVFLNCCVNSQNFINEITTCSFQHDSPSSPDPIEPPITNYVSEKNKPYVDLLLDNMKRGIVISATQGSIYAERVCKCAVFVYAPTSDGDYQFLLKLSR